MESGDVHFSGTEVTIGNAKWSVPYSILQATRIGDRVLVLYDWMTGPSHRQFQNLEAYTLEGVRLWTAEHPTNATADAYVKIVSASPLRVFSFAGYECLLDIKNGKILHAEFTR